MRIAILGGTGRIGSRVAGEATRRGHQVTVVSRTNSGEVDATQRVTGDAADGAQLAQLAEQHDVVVSAIGPTLEGDPSGFVTTMTRVADAVGSTRLIVVGGAGSLRSESGVRLVDLPSFPEAWRPAALVHAATLDVLRAGRADLNWTYFSPAPVIEPGERTGRFVLGGDKPVGEHVSMEDYAIALVDEIEQPRHERARFTIAAA